MESGYVMVGGGNLFISNYEKFNDDEKNEYIKMLKKLTTKTLYSFGSGLSKKTKSVDSDKYCNSMVNTIKKIRSKNKTIGDLITLYIDSGGYQCACGYIPKNEINNFVDSYAQYLEKEYETYDYAFSLDLPPFDNLFTSPDEMYEFNKYSYDKLFSLPEHVRKKILLVKHFRTPSQLKVWYKLITDELLEKFNSDYWAIGGIVASLSGEQGIPYITYSIPLSDIIRHTIQMKRNKINLHVLGGCAYRDIFFYALISRYLKLKKNIDLKFTYDSSGVIRQILLGRFINPIDDEYNIGMLSFKSELMEKKINGMTTNELVRYEIQKMLDWCDVKIEIPKNVYEGDNLEPKMEALLTTYQLYTFTYLKYIFENFVNTITLEEFENEDKFLDKVMPMLYKINRQKYTRKFKNKTYNLHRSILHCLYGTKEKNIQLIEHYTTKDEIKFNDGIVYDTF